MSKKPTAATPAQDSTLELLPPDQLQHMHLGTAGATFDKKMTLQEWQTAGRALANVTVSTGFALGDWLNFGKGQWPKDYAKAMEATGLAYDTLRKIASTCSIFPVEKRIAGLSLEHHRLLAPIKDEAKRAEIVAEVQAKKLSAGAMREILPKKPEPTKTPEEQAAADKKAAEKKNQEMLEMGQALHEYLNTLEDRFLPGWSSIVANLDTLFKILLPQAATARAEQIAADARKAEENRVKTAQEQADAAHAKAQEESKTHAQASAPTPSPAKKAAKKAAKKGK